MNLLWKVEVSSQLGLGAADAASSPTAAAEQHQNISRTAETRVTDIYTCILASDDLYCIIALISSNCWLSQT